MSDLLFIGNLRFYDQALKSNIFLHGRLLIFVDERTKKFARASMRNDLVQTPSLQLKCESHFYSFTFKQFLLRLHLHGKFEITSSTLFITSRLKVMYKIQDDSFIIERSFIWIYFMFYLFSFLILYFLLHHCNFRFYYDIHIQVFLCFKKKAKD